MDFLYSVSMCVYEKDNPIWFQTAVESVLNQTVKPDEIVLVVDGPVPNELDDMIMGYEKEPLFHVIRLAENQGHGNARRTGLAACKNELVAIMDADDICIPERFQKQLAVFEEHPETDVVGGQISEFIDSPDNIVGKRIVPLDDKGIKEYMKKRCPMNLVTVMFKKSSVEKAGGFVDWYCEEDYYLWIRMAIAQMVFGNVEDILVHVRVGNEMYQRRGGLKYFASEAKLQRFMFRKHRIGLIRFLINITERLILQVLMPNAIRGWIFQKLARQ